MPWKQTHAMEQRIRYVFQAEQRHEPDQQLCESFGIHRTTGWRWRKRLEAVGQIEQLGEHSRRPHHSPHETSSGIQCRVLELRETYGWGALKLQVLLAREGCLVSVATINRILKRHGAIEPGAAPRPATRRFERDRSNQLWQMDFKGIKDALAARCGMAYPLSVVDDHSRFLVGLFPLSDPGGASTWASLERVFGDYGVPDAMLMDHGTPWWSPSNGHGLTQVSVALIEQGIRLYFSGIGHPQTQGKVERLHRTMEHSLTRPGARFRGWAEWAAEFRHEYNHLRPHQALQMQVPAERYRASTREFQRRPAAYDYGAGAQLYRLNSKGCATYGRRRYFVCEALAGQEVALEPFRERILVRYRTTYVREIDVRTGATRPLMLVD
jgi:transposase InsO family protein